MFESDECDIRTYECESFCGIRKLMNYLKMSFSYSI